MESDQTVRGNPTCLMPDKFVQIVGRNMLQNQLLLSFLKNETGVDGTYVPTVGETSPIKKNDEPPVRLLIIDTKDVELNNLWDEIALWKREISNDCFLALFNVDPNLKIEKTAIAFGIRGLFYNNTKLPTIVKGISSILNGDIWYSREALKKCLLEIRPLLNLNKSTANSYLTIREGEILTLIASGYRNKSIADHLNLSEHTVKTHIYNIYKKLKVSNRLQASLWATKNLS